MTGDGMSDATREHERQAIREVVENWVLWRDAGDWERFATVWHDDGWMTATWFQGPARKFIEVSRQGFERGVSILHFLGGSTCDIAGTRAIAQTKMTINQRAEVEGVLVDVVCTGRFYDFFEKRDGRWAIVRRQPIYEKDRLDPVDPSRAAEARSGRARAFPEGYRHLAYLQSKNGFTVKDGLPGLRGPAVDKLYAEGAAWLAGSPTPAICSIPPLTPDSNAHQKQTGFLRRLGARHGVHEPVARLRYPAAEPTPPRRCSRGARRRLHPRRYGGALWVRRQRDADRRRAVVAAAGVRARQQVRHVPQRPGAARDRRPARGHHPGRATTACRACKTDVIDLYYLHRWDKKVPVEESAVRWPGSSRPARCGQSE